MLEWLLLPIDATRGHDIGFAMSWHARLMVISWGMLTPVAVLVARFYKITPNQNWPHELDNQFWWRFHLYGQLGSACIAVVALVFILVSSQNTGQSLLHLWLGYTVLTLGGLQLLSGFLRGNKGGPTDVSKDGSWSGDHYDMSRRRRLFETLHKGVGYIALALIIAAIVSGLWTANAPVWMWIGLCGWWLALVLFAALLQQQGRATDTYQAIWGPDTIHPGNRMPKRGIGTVRPSHHEASDPQRAGK